MIASTPYIEALSHIHEPEWLATTRRTSLQNFLEHGLPGEGEEDWKYTSLAYLEKTDLHAPDAERGGAVCPDVTAYPGHVLAFQNGELTCHGTYLSNQLAGTLKHMSDTLVVKSLLGTVIKDGALAQLNQALWRDGTRLYIPASSQVNVPVFAVYSTDEADAMVHPRNLVLVERDGEAILVEHYIGGTERNYWQNAVSEIILASGARLTHVRIQEEGPTATHTAHSAVRLARDSQYRVLDINLGSGLARHDLMVRLEGAGASVQADALHLADGRRHGDLHLRIDHLAPHTTSRVTYRGVANDRSRAVFDGRIVVDSDAHGTDARQSCRSLLLSPHAEVDAKPQLEIYADDVKCSHGATVGQLDADALFYLISRGIAPNIARRMLLGAFAKQALGLLDTVHLGDWLMPRIEAALARSTQ